LANIADKHSRKVNGGFEYELDSERGVGDYRYTSSLLGSKDNTHPLGCILVDEYPANDESILRSEACCAAALVAMRMEDSEACEVPVSTTMLKLFYAH